MIEILPVEGLPEIREGDDLAALIVGACELRAGDVVCIAQKIVSKAEGRVVRLADVDPSDEAYDLAGQAGDPRRLEVVLEEATRIVRSRPPLAIAETHHGFVCASAGVDASNAPEPDSVVLLPKDPDASAARIRHDLRLRTGHSLGVVVTDTFGRAWRVGIANVATKTAVDPTRSTAHSCPVADTAWQPTSSTTAGACS